MNQPSINRFIPLTTECTWFDELTGKDLTGWIVMVPANAQGYYTLSTKYKEPNWDKDDKAYYQKVLASKLKVVKQKV